MDVFQVVKALRIQKPSSVLTVVSISSLHVCFSHASIIYYEDLYCGCVACELANQY